MENELKCFKALKYLLIKNNLIDDFVIEDYLEGKWCLNNSVKNIYEVCFFENGKKTKKMNIRYPEFACCYVFDVLTDEHAKDLIKEFCMLLSMENVDFENLVWPVINQYYMEKLEKKEIKVIGHINSKKKEENFISDKKLAFLTKEHLKAKKVIESKIRVRKC